MARPAGPRGGRTPPPHGAQLLLLPEYAAMELAAGAAPDLAAELRGRVARSRRRCWTARARSRTRHGVWLLPGTLPFREGGRTVNRAPLIAPGGAVAFQDKHVMTRFEAEEWGVQPGAPPAVFDTALGPHRHRRLLRCGVPGPGAGAGRRPAPG